MNHQWIWLGFAVVFGAVFGSFINVIIYRLPAGISLLNPRFSFCPKCKHSIAWWENIPILAWFYLGARCTVCRKPISPIYPIIESLTAALFGLVYWALYISHFRAADFGAAHSGLAATWPVFFVYLALLICMIAGTVIDAKFYIIPLELPWIVTATAAVVLPLSVLVIQAFDPAGVMYYLSVSPQALGYWLGSAIGGGVGLALALVLMHAGILPRSLTDDDAAHDASVQHPHPHSHAAIHPATDALIAIPPAPGSLASAENPESIESPGSPKTSLDLSSKSEIPNPKSEILPPPPLVSQITPEPIPTPTSEPSANATTIDPQPPAALDPASPATELTSAPFAVAQASVSSDRPSAGEHADFISPVPQNPDELEAWLSYPHLNREMAKECLFVALPLLGFVLGALLYRHWINPVRPPLIPGWGQVLGGVVCGYLVGGGLIWITRIIGTFAFRKEAMGLGDIHLLAAIGAVMGPTDAALVFFIAPFLGLTYAAFAFGFSRILKGQVRIIPYGPFLAMAAVILMVFERAIWMKIGL